MKPLIGITSIFREKSQDYGVKSPYVEAVRCAGGLPVLLPASSSLEDAEALANAVDGLLIPGGIDVSPLLYGQQPIPQVAKTRRDFDLFETALIKAVAKQNKPIFGICRGMQIINVCFGGTLYQDIYEQVNRQICHCQDMDIRSEATHMVTLSENSRLRSIIDADTLLVNSYHHQAICDVAKGFTATAAAPDGVVEAIESDNGQILAVQWHPECLYRTMVPAMELFRSFVLCCSQSKGAR